MILNYQLTVFKRLLDVARAYFAIDQHSFPVKPRSNSLIIGPSGSGKTHIAKQVAASLEVPFLHLSVGEWMLLGGSQRGSAATWSTISSFLNKNKKAKGAVIFVDELDKVSNASSWETFLRAELFQLLDMHIPVGLSDRDSGHIEDIDIKSSQDLLANRTLIIGAGAFQSLWEDRQRPTVGFNVEKYRADKPTLNELTKLLPRELVNRFRSELLILPELCEAEYLDILLQLSQNIPQYVRDIFEQLGRERLQEAARLHQGCRFFEELMLDCVLAEQMLMRNVCDQIGEKNAESSNDDYDDLGLCDIGFEELGDR